MERQRRREERCRRGCRAASLLAEFVEDVTVPDAQAMTPGSAFTKSWRLRNSGEATWPAQGLHLLHISGPELGAIPRCPVAGPVRPGETVVVSVDMIAPRCRGRFVSTWRLVTPGGRRFGPRIWADIIVPTDAEGAAERVAESGLAGSGSVQHREVSFEDGHREIFAVDPDHGVDSIRERALRTIGLNPALVEASIVEGFPPLSDDADAEVVCTSSKWTSRSSHASCLRAASPGASRRSLLAPPRA